MSTLPIRFALLTLAVLVPALPLSAVVVESNAIKNRALYGITFPGETRAFYGKESALVSVSLQEYRTATFSVCEINLTADGSALLRIYHSRPLRAEELQEVTTDTATTAGAPTGIIQRPLPPGMRTLSDRAADTAEAMTSSTVIKEYPFATHAHTIEFRMRNRGELYALFEELQKHWLKEPAFFENGRIVGNAGNAEATGREMAPRSLGGTLFRVEN